MTRTRKTASTAENPSRLSEENTTVGPVDKYLILNVRRWFLVRRLAILDQFVYVALARPLSMRTRRTPQSLRAMI